VPFKAERMLVVACSNRDPARVVREVCTVGCIGCGACQRISDLFNVVDNLAGLDYSRYDPAMDFGPVIEKCPRESLVFVGKPTEKDLAGVAGEKLPERVEGDFKTSVDRTPYRG
jgi:ferredoxin